MKLSMIFGIVVIAFICIFGIIIGGGGPAALGRFIDFPSLILVGGVLVGSSLISFGLTIPGKALKNALSSKGVKSIDELRLYVNFFNMASQLSIAGGVVGTLVGNVNMLATMNNPSTIGASMAVALLTVFYGVLLSELVFQPLKHALIIKSVDVIEDSTGIDSGLRKNNRWLVLGLGVFTGIVPFLILIVSLG